MAYHFCRTPIFQLLQTHTEYHYFSIMSSLCSLFISHLQTVPSSQTQIKIDASLDNAVCRIAVTHFGWVKILAFIKLGSTTSKL